MLRSFVILFLFCLINVNLFSQEKEEKKYWLTTSLNVFVPISHSASKNIGFDYHSTYHYQMEHKNFLSPGIGVKIEKNNLWFQEYSLSYLNAKKDDYYVVDVIEQQGVTVPVRGIETTSVGLNLRVEYGKLISPKNMSRLKYGLSLSIDPYFNYFKDEPITSALIPVFSYRIGGELSIIPRIEVALSRRIHMNIKLPMGINRFSYEHFKIDDPLLADEKKEVNHFFNEFGMKYFQSNVGLNIML